MAHTVPTSSSKSAIVAVVVTYHPILEVLEQLLDALVPQVTSIVLVDNGSYFDQAAWYSERGTRAVELLWLGENRGIAAAQNVGIQWARDHGAGFVLLMDQDSIPAPDMVEKLIFAIYEQPSPAAAGPRYLDERQDNPRHSYGFVAYVWSDVFARLRSPSFLWTI